MTGQEATWVGLAGLVDSAGREFVMRGSTPAVRLARLHADPRTRASVSLVSFPPGWHRPGAGHYLAGEEFVLVHGDLLIGDERFTAGDWAWLAPMTVRAGTSSATGALAVAWFSGPAVWQDGAGGGGAAIPPARGSVRRPGRLRGPTAEVPGETAVLKLLAPGRTDVDCDLLDAARLQWCFTPAGAALPTCPRPVLLRRWS